MCALAVAWAKAPAMDRAAVEILQRMTDFVSGLQQFSVHTESTPELISTVTVMSDWNLAPKAPDTALEFVPSAGAQAISFMPLDETSDFGR